MSKKVIVIGGGAAGIFAAINCKETHPSYDVTLLEKSNKLLSKVKVSGGGRCNVTNSEKSLAQFSKNYPRGSRFIKKCFNEFNAQDTVDWFKKNGASLHTESDGRMFPITNNSSTIMDTLLNKARSLKIELRKKVEVISITKESRFKVITKEESFSCDYILVATGGSAKAKSYDWLINLNHTLNEPLPSLFTFNMPNENHLHLKGLSMNNIRAKIVGTKLESNGALLLTHWGMSGPAILKLSAWGAKELASMNYHFQVAIDWLNKGHLDFNSSKRVWSNCQIEMPNRLWHYILSKIGIPQDSTYLGLSKKNKNKLVNVLTNDIYEVEGKTTFKEEFVTCGGIPLNEINNKTMESKICPNLYFCGEVMDIDGITGGFNFQAAWTTGYLAGKLK